MGAGKGKMEPAFVVNILHFSSPSMATNSFLT